MAITVEMLRANPATAGISDEVAGAIAQMSVNDEASVIGQKTGEIYGGLDTDILNTSGMEKNGTEKTYDYAKRVIGELKKTAESAGGLQAQVAELTKERDRLQKVISDGGADAETARELKRVRADLANVTKEYTDLKGRFDASETEHARQLMDVRLEGEFAKASAGIKLKGEYPASVADVLMKQAIDRVKGMSPEFIDDGTGTGKKVLAFKDKTGAIMRNPETNLEPFTASELVRKQLEEMGVVDNGRRQSGAGSQQNGGGGGQQQTAAGDISGARTQSEASEIITKQLMAQGLVVGSDEYQKKFNEVWKANLQTLKGLPIR